MYTNIPSLEIPTKYQYLTYFVVLIPNDMLFDAIIEVDYWYYAFTYIPVKLWSNSMDLRVKANNVTNQGGASNTIPHTMRWVGLELEFVCVEMWAHHIVGLKVGTLPTQPLGLHQQC